MAMRHTTCCGMYELSDLWPQTKWTTDTQNVENTQECCDRILKEVYKYGFKKMDKVEGWHNKKPFVVFTDVDSNKNGSILEQYIHDKGLGVTFTSNAKYNPNSGNKSLRVYIWEVDWNALKKHCVPPKKAVKAPRKAVRKIKPTRARVVAAYTW